MSIVGIIRGFCDPQETNKNLILIGRNGTYVLVENGQPIKNEDDLESAQNLIFQYLKKLNNSAHWVEVDTTSTSSVGHTIVCSVRSGKYFTLGYYLEMKN